MKRLINFFAMGILALAMAGCCELPANRILVASATTIGFDVSESSATASPQATLAYKRAELVIVPCLNNGTNAIIVPDVLMDFTFKTSLWSADGGIYSRIATGPLATTHTPATMMMSANHSGNTSTNLTATAISTLLNLK